MDSAKRRPNTPVVCKANASVPTKGPKPADIKSSAAQTNSGIERNAFKRNRVIEYQADFTPFVVLLAGKASKSPRKAAIREPRADIAKVSRLATPSFDKNFGSRFGESSSPKNFPIRTALSIESIRASCKSSVQKLSAISTAIPMRTQ
jgi:hypothetical protein